MAGQRGMNVKNPWSRTLILIIAFLFIMVIVGLVTTAVVQNKPIPQKYKYGIVLDAGSSHTSVYVYEWPAEKENNTGMVRQKHACNVKGKGISSYSGNAVGAGNSLRECMEEVKAKIPIQRHYETPVYLGATAGMRLLSKENESASNQVLDSVKNFLQALPFSFEGARIISGQEEGAYGWITVNYLSDNFRTAPKTMGALDLGGASTQITFVSEPEPQSAEDFIHFRLYGNEYNVYTHSFLCYGKDQALRLALDNKLTAQTAEFAKQTTVRDPCFHPGYRKEKLLTDVYGSPCVSHHHSSFEKFILEGVGNWSQCHNSILQIFNFTQCDNNRGCSFNNVFQPPVQGQFGAFSAFFFVMDFLNLTMSSLEKTKESLMVYCSTLWPEVQQRFPHVKEKYLAEYCFSGTYILTLLENGYNFTTDTWKDITFMKKIRDSDAGWTLGYMLNLTNMIPAEAPDGTPLPHAGYVAIMIILALLLFCILFISCRFIRRSESASPKEVV